MRARKTGGARRPRVADGKKVLIQSRVDPSVKDGVNELAGITGMTQSSYVRKVLTDHLAEHLDPMRQMEEKRLRRAP